MSSHAVAEGAGVDSDLDWEQVTCEEGGWANGSSEEQYDSDEPIPLVPKLQPPAQPPRSRSAAPSMDRDRLWIEDVSFQVGNAAHEIRNALRFWASLVSESDGQAKVLLQQFKKADNTSGKLEGTMRGLVGKVRNMPLFWAPVGKSVPKAQTLLTTVRAQLAPLGQAVAVAEDQRRAVEQLLGRQEAYLASIAEAHTAGCVPEFAPELPPPGNRVDFDLWRDQENEFVVGVAEAEAAQQRIPAEHVIALARLACNSSHQLQNLASAPSGGLGSEAHKLLRRIDNVAGKCENASRAIMVFAHRVHQLQSMKPMAKIADRALFLQQSAEQCSGLLGVAIGAEGGDTVPAEAFKTTLERLTRVAVLLHGLVPEEFRQSTRQARAKRGSAAKRDVVAAVALGSKCAGCDFAVTGVSPAHCCRRCAKHPGKHGGACQRQAVV